MRHFHVGYIQVFETINVGWGLPACTQLVKFQNYFGYLNFIKTRGKKMCIQRLMFLLFFFPQQMPVILAGNKEQQKKYLGRLIDEPLLAVRI